MKILLTEREQSHLDLLPLTYTRSIGDLRIGILTIAEKWGKYLEATVEHRTTNQLQELYTLTGDHDLFIDASILPDENLVPAILSLDNGQALYYEDQLIATKENESHSDCKKIIYTNEITKVNYSWDLFRLNGQEIRKDFELITASKRSEELADAHTICYGKEIFIENGAKIKAAVLNAENGPIYLGKNSEVQEGSVIRGPFSLGESSVVKMGAKIREGTTIGPHSKVGGELSNSILFGFSNKGHDGFLGNSVIGEWCNLGADTNNSNLKNNYAEIKMWNYTSDRFIKTGLQFCGLIMGDHSKCGINTMFNTGTTVGVSANIFGEGFPRNIIPSFAWGGSSGYSTYLPKKAFETAQLMMKRKGKILSETEEKVLLDIFDQTAKYRSWEK